MKVCLTPTFIIEPKNVGLATTELDTRRAEDKIWQNASHTT